MKAAFTTVKSILVPTMYTIYKDSKNKPTCFIQTTKVPLPDPLTTKPTPQTNPLC